MDKKHESYSNRNMIPNWRDFFLGYLKAADSCAEEYINKKPGIGFRSYGKFCYIPAFWNFKHALELGIKFLARDSGLLLEDILGHSDKLEKVAKQRGIDKHKTKDLEKICEKYYKLLPLKKLKEFRTKTNFLPPVDEKNQLFHYPEAKTPPHRDVFEQNPDFAYYFMTTERPYNNEEKMVEIMKELQDDTRTLSKILADLLN